MSTPAQTVRSGTASFRRFPWRAALLGLWIGHGAGLACAAPTQYYAGGGLLPERSERHRTRLLDELREALAESGIQSLEISGPAAKAVEIRLSNGNSPALAELPLPVLQAAALSARLQERGAEFDWIAPNPAQPPGTLISVRHDLDHHLRVILGGAVHALEGPAPSERELTERYKIGPLLEEDARWSASDRRALAAALSLLTPAELAYLQALPFRREQRGPSEDEAGYYAGDEEYEGGLIVLFDATFDEDDDVYVGSPQRAYPRSVDVILHEIGHAIAQLDQEQLAAARQRDMDHYNELVELSNRYAEDLEERQELAERLRRRTDRARVQAEIEQLEGDLRKLDDTLGRARRQLRDLDRRIEDASPMEQAYAELPGSRRGPTPYGKTSVIEGFAESFSLFHLDPDSLARFSPEIHAWFQGARHLAASRYSPLAGVSAPVGQGGPEQPGSTPHLEM